MSRRRRRKNKSKLKTRFNFNKLLLFAIPTIFIGGTVAKYVQERNEDLIYQAKNFYFESDLLSDNTDPAAYTYDVGNDTIVFELSNNIDDLRHSEVDINYTVSITDVQGNQVTDKDGKVISEQSGKLSNNNIDMDEIEFENLPTGNYIVTAKAVSPYEKTLQATFVLTERNENIQYEINDAVGSPILQMTVRTSDYRGDVTIIWPDGIAPDNTNSKLTESNTGYSQGEETIFFETDSEYTFQFFKKQPDLIYTKNDFSVEGRK